MTVPATTDVLIVGGGPAGALLGCLLARRGIEVLVVEKQQGLERDFRGETLAAPSAVTLRRLGFGPALTEHGYLETTAVSMRMEGRQVFRVDYSRFPVGVLPIDIPQPALIGMFNEAAAGLPGHTYAAGTAFTGLLQQDGAVHGAVLKLPDGSRAEVRTRLLVGADGRFSKVRKAAGLAADVRPMQRDFLSFKLPRPADWGTEAELVVLRDKHLVVLPTFPDYLRVGHNLPKRGLGDLRKEGFEAFRDGIAAIDPRLAPLLAEHLLSWDDTSFLEIFTAEVPTWSRDGLVLLGDASHTVTPILGQGVNLAIQDAVCLAPVIARALGGTGTVVPGSAFDEFAAGRRRHKAFVTRFQRMQEAALAQHTPLRTALRRLRFRTLNSLPAKYRIFDKVINAPHPIDPVDLRTTEPAPAPAA
ncbi:FAD-dependent monooxygenase [Kitasatospora viridis]|uniref:2-polyprenyl-6-methoxyphenol hydroxylase-like FAD-dependent oxidoreductase n=1 Tax=Kitasatospora viridis TaxID=281105 RepID=A0A561UJX4_9ACTN|nr:FAD-dependent monooxygenase [Kitasatospora viridis]TWF99636.1 2-polyprenyl-6-methoxyphenol hydroxylase-like FAD-dependent oxidoreductase [Kitasatospora viridis]